MTHLNISNYIDYFRQLAVSHKNLKHDPETEYGNGSIGGKHFARWSAEEVVTGLRTTVNFVPAALLLELYNVHSTGESPYDIKGTFKGAFTILSHATPEDVSSEIDAFEMAETITYDILSQIWQDHYSPTDVRSNTPFHYFNFNDLDIMPVSKLFDNEFGFRVEFIFEFRRTSSITTPPATGTFINYDYEPK